MNASESEGLGLSVLIYASAIFGTLAVVAVPIYLAVKPQVYENPPLVRADPLLNGPIVGYRVSTRVPLAILKRETILDPKIVAALNAKVRNVERHASQQVAARRPQGTPVAELRDEPQRPTFFLFKLFGG